MFLKGHPSSKTSIQPARQEVHFVILWHFFFFFVGRIRLPGSNPDPKYFVNLAPSVQICFSLTYYGLSVLSLQKYVSFVWKFSFAAVQCTCLVLRFVYLFREHSGDQLGRLYTVDPEVRANGLPPPPPRSAPLLLFFARTNHTLIICKRMFIICLKWLKYFRRRLVCAYKSLWVCWAGTHIVEASAEHALIQHMLKIQDCREQTPWTN